MKKVNTAGAPVAPYSQAVISGGLIFVSGLLGADEQGAVVGGIEEQTQNALKALSRVLIAAGSGLPNVVKTTCFLTDIKDAAAFNKVYAEYLSEKPARTMAAVAALPKGSLIEIDAIAEIVKA